MHSNFENLCNRESLEFKAILSILLRHSDDAQKGRKLLCLVNHILDYYILGNNNSNDVRMPIVYFPRCDDWAQKLCEEFVALKMSVLFGDTTRAQNAEYLRTHPYLVLPPRPTRYQQSVLKEQRAFRKRLAEHLVEDVHSYPAMENEKCLIYSRSIADSYLRSLAQTPFYHFSQDFIGKDFSDNKSLILLEDNEEYLFERISNNDGKIKFPHMFLFLQKDLDGRASQFCMQLSRSTINEYNEDYDSGIKTVFFFVFSGKPYRLQNIFDNKQNLVERLQRERVADTRDFISFTKEEMDYIFDRKDNSIRYYDLALDNESEQYQIKRAFDILLQDIPHEVKIRNELAICFTESSRTRIQNEILGLNPEANADYISFFLKVLQLSYQKELENILYNWIGFRQIALVLDYQIDQYYKDQLAEYLESECGATSVSFYTFKSLYPHKQDGILQNSIIEDRILVLSLLNHCTGKTWAIYPNSFDQFHLNTNQTLLQVNNLLVFDPHYSWYQYRYIEQQRLLLNSSFRKEYVKNAIPLPTKPINIGVEPKDDEDEQNYRGRINANDQVRYTITFVDNQHRTLGAEDLVLCNNLNNWVIYSVADVRSIFDDPTIQELEIQPLIDFVNSLRSFINNQEKSIGDGECLIRNSPKYCLSREEKDSKREMWKILLEHRVREKGEQAVYDEIMQPLLPIERVQLQAFRSWLDPHNSSILPRSRRMQKRVLEDYLGIENLYTRLLRHRKSRTSTNTEDQNSIYREFLTHCLTATDTQEAYDKLRYEVRDYLNVASGEDVEIILDYLKEDALNLKTITSISAI